MSDQPNIATPKEAWLKAIESKFELKLAIKTAIAAMLSWFLGMAFSKAFARPDTVVSGLWCVLSSIVVLQAQLGGTHKAAWVRFLGVAVGSVMGSVFFAYLGAEHLASLGVSIFLTIVLCALLNLKESFRIASLSAAVIIVLGGLNPTLNPWIFSLFRFLDSCIGILVAVFVAHVLWPERAAENLRVNVIKMVRLLQKQYRLATDLHQEGQAHAKAMHEIIIETQALAQENVRYLEESKLELLSGAPHAEGWMLVVTQIDAIFESVTALKDVDLEMVTKIFDDGLSREVTHVIAATETALQDLEKSLEKQQLSFNSAELLEALRLLNQDLLRFRSTRTTRKFSLEDVESFFVFFYRLRAIGEGIIKIEEHLQKLWE